MKPWPNQNSSTTLQLRNAVPEPVRTSFTTSVAPSEMKRSENCFFFLFLLFFCVSFLFLALSSSWSLGPRVSHLLLCVSSLAAVESLYAALKSIDRLDIVNMLEGQQGAPPPPARQGSRDLNRHRHHDREHLSPGLTNGEFTFYPPPPPLPLNPQLPLHCPHRGHRVWPRPQNPATRYFSHYSLKSKAKCLLPPSVWMPSLFLIECLYGPVADKSYHKLSTLGNRQRDSGHSYCTVTPVASVNQEQLKF